MPAKVLVQS